MTERINKPPARLSQYKVGDTVVLKEANSTDWPFFIGEETDGYFMLYHSESTFNKGKPWIVAAALCHPVKEQLCVRVASANQ